jgi:hypothetical protein
VVSHPNKPIADGEESPTTVDGFLSFGLVLGKVCASKLHNYKVIVMSDHDGEGARRHGQPIYHTVAWYYFSAWACARRDESSHHSSFHA